MKRKEVSTILLNVTDEYAGMIEAFECDFSLAAEANSKYGLDKLQIKIKQGDERMLADIKLLKKLSFGIRYGDLKIVEEV